MKPDIGIFGTCVSSGILRTEHNNYDDYFNLALIHQRSSIISLMHEPLEYNLDDIRLLPRNELNDYCTECIVNDFSKKFLEDIASTPLDYLMMDINFDVVAGLLQIGDTYITNSPIDIQKTKFYRELDNKKELHITSDCKKFFSIWKSCCDSFFDYLDDKCPDMQIILNRNLGSYHVLKSDSSIVKNERFKEESDKFNPYFILLEEHILKKDVIGLEFDECTLADENHIWGCIPYHYDKQFYWDRLDELIEIAKADKKL